MEMEDRMPGKDEQGEPRETATFGGGCFWCLEPAFAALDGVLETEPGYAGGHAPAPDYRSVCSGTTGHAEVVRVVFDAERITFRELLEVFFSLHDPTTPDRQGADVGPQYRSIILHESEAQREEAERMIRELDAKGVWAAPIVTQVAPLERFHPAEAEHRDYYRRNSGQPYCQVVIAPKLARFRKRFGARIARGREAQ
jgi:peptide-methionine (S)-S-oxide reductase